MGNAQEQVLTFARQALLERIAGAKVRIWLASPFISTPIAGKICEAATGSGAGERRLLTDLDERAVRCGVLDPKALERLRSCRFEIRSIENLHAKLSIVDSRWALLGSGNLTGAGLGGEAGGGNYEMGVLLNPGQRKLAREIYADWWGKAERVTPEQIHRFDQMRRFPMGRNRRVGPKLALPTEASLEEILEEDRATSASRGYWVNANYHAPQDPMWWRRDWVSDGGKKLYRKGDLLVVYLGTKNGGPQLCPAILRVVRPPREEPEFVLAERDQEAADRWPWVTRTSKVAEVSPFDGVPLELADKSPLSVENGCGLTRPQFEKLARALRAKLVG